MLVLVLENRRGYLHEHEHEHVNGERSGDGGGFCDDLLQARMTGRTSPRLVRWYGRPDQQTGTGCTLPVCAVGTGYRPGGILAGLRA